MGSESLAVDADARAAEHRALLARTVGDPALFKATARSGRRTYCGAGSGNLDRVRAGVVICARGQRWPLRATAYCQVSERSPCQAPVNCGWRFSKSAVMASV